MDIKFDFKINYPKGSTAYKFDSNNNLVFTYYFNDTEELIGFIEYYYNNFGSLYKKVYIDKDNNVVNITNY